MALSPRLDLRQQQALVMTPQLQQAIKLLQLNNLELTAYVEAELEQNPLLERNDREDGDYDDPRDAEPEPQAEPREAVDTVEFNRSENTQEAVESAYDMDYDNLWNNDSAGDATGAASGASGGGEAFADWGKGGGQAFDNPEFSLENTLSGEISLREHLTGQLNVALIDPVDRMIGLQLIDMLDASGYIMGSLLTVAETLGCPIEQVEAVLIKVQEFDPPGIFARDLAECLALQLADRNRLDPAMEAMLANLDKLAKRDIAGLLRICGVDQEDLAEMIDEIRALDPKPALAFDHAVAQPITPDVLMRPNPAGGWIVELNSDTLPRVLVNNHYYAQVSRDARSKEERQYIAERMQSANWLVKSLHQRATTIMKVATEIVRQQDAFFRKGVQHLRPLVLRDIATAIEMHESTVSRVTSNKYMTTPRGIFELKYFFTPAIASSSGGDSHSAESVRHRIKSMIDAEDPKAILSDDRLVEILKAEGVDIARRTVAKYREAMRIPSSVQRRREKSGRI